MYYPQNLKTLETNSNHISQELLETVERYINNTMTSEELKSFETRLQTDAAFKVQVDDIRTLLTGIESQALKEQLDDFHKAIDSNKTQNSQAKIRYLNVRRLVAAAAIVIAVGSFWFFNQNSPENLYAKYFTPDPGLPTTMSNQSNYEFYEAMVDYKQGKYKSAIEKWNAISQKNDTINYFIGVAHLADKNENDAILFIEKSVQNSSFPLANDAYYYLGLAALKNGNETLAETYLKQSNLEKSKALLSELLD